MKEAGEEQTIPSWPDGDLLKMTGCLSNLFGDKIYYWIGTVMLTAKTFKMSQKLRGAFPHNNENQQHIF